MQKDQNNELLEEISKLQNFNNVLLEQCEQKDQQLVK